MKQISLVVLVIFCIANSKAAGTCDESCNINNHQKCDEFNGECICEFGYKMDTGNNNNKCIKNLIGDPCKMEKECKLVLNSQCLDGACACLEGYVVHKIKNNLFEDTKCEPVRKNINEQCVTSLQCTKGDLGDGAMCSPKGKCTCQDDHRYNDRERKCEKGSETTTPKDGKGTCNVISLSLFLCASILWVFMK